MKKLKIVLLTLSAVVAGLWIINYFVDTRAFINLFVADIEIYGRKSCTKRISKFEVVDESKITEIAKKAENLNYAVDLGPSMLIIVIPMEKRVYRFHIWRKLHETNAVDAVSIQITEGNSLGSVTDVCYVPNRVIVSEIKKGLSLLGINLKKGEHLRVVFGYGIGSFIL